MKGEIIIRTNINTTTDIFGNVSVRESDCPLKQIECNTVNFSCKHFEGCNGNGTKGRCLKLLESTEKLNRS